MNVFKNFCTYVGRNSQTFFHVSVIQYQVKESENSFRKYKFTATVQHLTITQLLMAFDMET